MKKYICLSLSLFLVISYAKAQSEPERVQTCFQDYKSAILASDGSDAVKYVNENTLKYYGDILDYSLNADSVSLLQLGLLDKMMILIIRYKVPVSELVKMNNKKLFIYAVDKGMIGRNSVSETEIGEVEVEGSEAVGSILIGGVEAPFEFSFQKEHGQWKIDLTSIMWASEEGIQSYLETFEMSDIEFIYLALGIEEGTVVATELWKPMILIKN